MSALYIPLLLPFFAEGILCLTPRWGLFLAAPTFRCWPVGLFFADLLNFGEKNNLICICISAWFLAPGARGRTLENCHLSTWQRWLLAGRSGAHRRPSPPASDSIASPGDGPFTRWPRRVVRPIRHRRAAKHDPSAARLACDKSGPVRRLRCMERRPSSDGTACAAGVARVPSANGPASYSAACSHRPCQWTNGPMRPHARALVMAGRERDRRRSSSRPLRSAARSAAPGARAVTGS